MRTIAAGQFKANCLALMDEVQANHLPVLITKRGKPVAKLVPVDEDPAKDSFIGCYKGRIEILGDIVSPITSQADLDEMNEDWNMLK